MDRTALESITVLEDRGEKSEKSDEVTVEASQRRRTRTPTPQRGHRVRTPTPQRAHARAPSPRRLIATAAESDPPTALIARGSFVDLPPGSIVDETYEIDAKLGAGAMGEVYAARHIKLGKRVAIKVIGTRLSEDSAAIERFALEARTLAQIHHPAIVAVDHVGELADGRAYFVMEFLRGEVLHARLQRGRMPLPEALRILDQMARGLEAAHEQGIIHRDLKPENTFLVQLSGEAPMVKLLDFGLAKLGIERAGLDQRAERTQSGVAIGTPMYMSPEQARGPDVDHRTDVYALGCVAYELLLGQVPFPHARAVPELYAAHLHESPPLPRAIWPEIPPQLDLVLFAMLAKDPAHRPTLAQVRSVIATAQTSESQRAATQLVAPRTQTSRPRLRTAAIATIALIGGLVLGSALEARSKRSQPAPAALVEQTPILAPAPPSVEPPSVEIAPVEATPAESAVPATKALVASPRPSRSSRSARVAAPPDGGVDASTVADLPPVEKKPTPRPSKPTPLDKNAPVDPFAKNKVTP
jgi:serine/threonine-protein kinase